MRKSCGHHLPCICHRNASEIDTIINIVEFRVKNQIERCLQKYMSLEETMTYLKNTHQIHPPITKTVWKKLVRDNPDFFKAYFLRCETLRQIKIFNSLLEQQATLMLEHGLFDLTNPTPAIAKILGQDPGLYYRALMNHKPSHRSEVSPQSLSLPYTNGPRVNQLQIPNDQHPQHHYQCSTHHDFAYSRVPTVAQAATTAQDPSTSQIRGHIRDNSLRELQTLQLGGSNNRIHSRELFNRLQNGESSNGILNGGSTNGMLNREKINGIQIGGMTNGLLNGGSNDGLQNLANRPLNQLQIPNDQQPQSHNQWSTSHDLAYSRVPSFAQAATTAQDPSTSQIRDHTRYNSLSMDSTVLEMQYLPQLQTLEHEGISNGLLSGGRINGLQNAENINRLHYGVTNNRLQNGGSTNRLLNGGSINGLQGVIPLNHHLFHDSKIVHAQGEPLYPILESEASNSLDSVNQLQIPNDQQPQHHNQYSRLQTLQYGGSNSELQIGGRIDQQLDLLRQQQRPGP